MPHRLTLFNPSQCFHVKNVIIVFTYDLTPLVIQFYSNVVNVSGKSLYGMQLVSICSNNSLQTFIYYKIISPVCHTIVHSAMHGQQY